MNYVCTVKFRYEFCINVYSNCILVYRYSRYNLRFDNSIQKYNVFSIKSLGLNIVIPFDVYYDIFIAFLTSVGYILTCILPTLSPFLTILISP